MAHGSLLSAATQLEKELMAYALVRLNLGADDAADLLQQVRINAARLDAKGFVANAPRALLFSLMERYARNFSRSRRNALKLAESLRNAVNADGGSADSTDLWPILLAMAKLSVLLRDTFVARSVLGLNYREMGTLLDKPTTNLRQHHNCATRQVRQLLTARNELSTGGERKCVCVCVSVCECVCERERERERE